MNKSLFALVCALRVPGPRRRCYGRGARTRVRGDAHLEAAIFSQPQGCAQDLSLEGVPAPMPMGQCSGGEGGSCDRPLDCQGTSARSASSAVAWAAPGAGAREPAAAARNRPRYLPETSRKSQARAARQWRPTVGADIPRISAVSSAVKPPK